MAQERSNGRRAADLDLDSAREWRMMFREISPVARLTFAKQLLCGLGLISIGVMVAYGLFPQNDALKAMFELVKIGMLPIVTLTASYYFPNHK